MGNKRLITFVFCLPVTIVLSTADAQRPVVTPSSAPAGAVSAPRRATEDDPIYAEIFRVWSGGDQAKAEQMLDQAVRLNPANVRLAFFHAACTRSRFDVSGALPLFRAVVSASPDSAEGQCSQIMMKLDSGTDVASQFASLLRLADDCADDPLITWMVGVQSRSLNRNEIGVKYYQRLSGMVDPGPSLMHQTFANLLDEVKRYDEALVHRKIVVKQEPAPWSYEGLGNTLQSLARYEEACAAYTKALEMSPNDPRLLWDLGDTLYHV
jgi:tetratricopeptide (TPR) repeat protein